MGASTLSSLLEETYDRESILAALTKTGFGKAAVLLTLQVKRSVHASVSVGS